MGARVEVCSCLKAKMFGKDIGKKPWHMVPAQKGRCVYCGRPVTKKTYEFEEEVKEQKITKSVRRRVKVMEEKEQKDVTSLEKRRKKSRKTIRRKAKPKKDV